MIKRLTLILIFLTIFVACDEEEVWQKVEDEKTYNEIIQFMEEYKQGWEESLTTQSFSIMEDFFVGNSHLYHMERRQHQQLVSEWTIEKFQGAHEIIVKVNQFDEYKVHWVEEVLIERNQEVTEKVREREYYMSLGENGYRLIEIKREE